MTSPENEAGRHFEQIRPAPVKLSAAESQAPVPPAAQRSARTATWMALAALGAVAIAVIFLLPRWVSPPKTAAADTPASPAAAKQVVPVAGPPVAAGGAAPFSQALQAQQRKDAQAALERLLELQKKLKEIGVETWAGEAFTAAIRLAEEGDALYGTQDFAGAGEKYAQSVEALEALQARSAEVHAQALEDGLAAIAAGKAAAAAEAFRTALLIHPDDPDATKGLARAEKLDEVLAIVAEGRGHLDADRLKEAEETFQRALALDPETASATAGLEEARSRIVDERFRAAMSRGYGALEAGDLDSARRHFGEAAQIKPSATDAQSGLRDVQNRIASARIRTLLDEARALEQDEKWQDAVARYDAALKIDGNLLPARQGREAAVKRAALDARLKEAVARPERLSDRNVREQAAALIREAGAVRNPGSELKKQIAVLSALLAQAEVPVTVTIQSNAETDVVIHRVGALGRFATTEASLLPGRYVAVGTRNGFRDVRVEFEITAGQPPPTVVVQCSEPVTAGR